MWWRKGKPRRVPTIDELVQQERQRAADKKEKDNQSFARALQEFLGKDLYTQLGITIVNDREARFTYKGRVYAINPGYPGFYLNVGKIENGIFRVRTPYFTSNFERYKLREKLIEFLAEMSSVDIDD